LARYFDSASSQYLQSTSVVVNPFPVSIAGWFNADLLTDDCVASLCTSGSNNLVQVYVSGGNKLALYIESGGSSTNLVGATSLSTGTWYHFAAISDGVDHSIYLNGSSDASNSTVDLSFGASLNRTCIAHAVYSGSETNFFKGSIAEVGFYSGTLASGDVSALANRYSPLLVRPDILGSYYPLCSDDGDSDQVGRNNLTATNSPTYSNHIPVIYPHRSNIQLGVVASFFRFQPAWSHNGNRVIGGGFA